MSPGQACRRPRGRLTFCACALCACAGLPVSLVSAYRSAGPCACLVTSPFAAEAGGRQTSPHARSRTQPCNWGRLGPKLPQLHGTAPNPANGGLGNRAQNHAFGEVSDPTFPRGRGERKAWGQKCKCLVKYPPSPRHNRPPVDLNSSTSLHLYKPDEPE